MHKKKLLTALIGGLALSSTAAIADDRKTGSGFYIELNGYLNQAEDSNDRLQGPDDPGTPPLIPPSTPDPLDVDGEYDDGEGFGMVFGYDFAGGLRAEIEGRQISNDIEMYRASDGTEVFSGEAEIFTMLANMIFDFREDSWWRPYFGVGVGVSEIEKGGFEDDVAHVEVGVGVSFDLTNHLALDVGYRFADTEDAEYDTPNGEVTSEYSAHLIKLGLRYTIAHGPQEVDSDGDGVADPKDQCPNTPLGRAVDDVGCELDSDGDGVLNSADACAGTPAGQEVMSNGCAVEQAAVLRGVNFEFDSDRLTYEAESILDKVARTLLDSPGFVVEVQGHTDSQGGDFYNQNLSEARARSVRKYLMGKGVDGIRMIATGYGETRPVADNDTREGRAENRRVELLVVSDDADERRAAAAARRAEAEENLRREAEARREAEMAQDDMAEDDMSDEMDAEAEASTEEASSEEASAEPAAEDSSSSDAMSEAEEADYEDYEYESTDGSEPESDIEEYQPSEEYSTPSYLN